MTCPSYLPSTLRLSPSTFCLLCQLYPSSRRPSQLTDTRRIQFPLTMDRYFIPHLHLTLHAASAGNVLTALVLAARSAFLDLHIPATKVISSGPTDEADPEKDDDLGGIKAAVRAGRQRGRGKGRQAMRGGDEWELDLESDDLRLEGRDGLPVVVTLNLVRLGARYRYSTDNAGIGQRCRVSRCVASGRIGLSRPAAYVLQRPRADMRSENRRDRRTGRCTDTATSRAGQKGRRRTDSGHERRYASVNAELRMCRVNGCNACGYIHNVWQDRAHIVHKTMRSSPVP